MLNAVRGEVQLVVGKRTFILCLSLGAMAMIEEGLKVNSLAEIDKVFATPKAKDLAILVHALIRGGGSDETPEREKQLGITLQNVLDMPLNMKNAMEAVKQAFTAINSDDDEEDASAPQFQPAQKDPVEELDEVGPRGNEDEAEGLLEPKLS